MEICAAQEGYKLVSTPTEIRKLRRDQIEARVRERLAETGPERCRWVETALQRERAAIEARLIHQDMTRYMGEAMEEELIRIAEEIEAGRGRGLP